MQLNLSTLWHQYWCPSTVNIWFDN
jgi:hypothetical protein